MAKGKVLIDSSRCKGCYLCVKACPNEVLTISKKINEKGFQIVEIIAPDKCTGCTLCAIICPDIALEIKRSS